MKNKISPKWAEVAKYWVGNKEGRHCHWCKYSRTNDGEVYCNHPQSKFYDGDRIRSWDGEGCAEDCPYFELDKWYTSDKNYEATFKKKNKKEE